MMFVELRSKFIIITMTLLVVVIGLSFSAIYLSTAARFNFQPGISTPTISRERATQLDETTVQDYITAQRQEDADATLQGLIITLVITGLATLFIAYFVISFFADRAILPIRSAYEKQKQFIVDAGHELKTPISVISANIEAEFTDKKEHSQWLKHIQEETVRMNEFIENLLMLSKLEASEHVFELDRFDVSKELDSVLSSLEPLIKNKSLKLLKNIERPLFVTSNPSKVRQIFAIIMDNAIKYTSTGGDIEVQAMYRGNKVEISVINSHVLISEQKLSLLFERFYQADASHQDTGHGLGLAIAKTIASSLNTTLSVKQFDGRIAFRFSINKK